MKKFVIVTFFLLLAAFNQSVIAQKEGKPKHKTYSLCINPVDAASQTTYQFCSDDLQKYPDDKRPVEFNEQWITFYKVYSETIKAKHAAYFLCINNMNEPQTAYPLCSEYLRKYPDDDKRLVEFARQWIKAYEKIWIYLSSLQPLVTSDASQSWMIYKPDLEKKILNVSDKDDSHKIEITRRFDSPEVDEFLKKAEAVYPSAEKISHNLFENWRYFSQPEASLPYGEPKWWTGYFDTILSTEIVTTGAVLYYQNLSEQLQKNNDKIKENSFTFHSTELKYLASIKKLKKYERNGQTFNDIYLADMTLIWSQACGGLCGHGFTRNKVVILDENGNILEMFLDAPVNRTFWVS